MWWPLNPHGRSAIVPLADEVAERKIRRVEDRYKRGQARRERQASYRSAKELARAERESSDYTQRRVAHFHARNELFQRTPMSRWQRFGASTALLGVLAGATHSFIEDVKGNFRGTSLALGSQVRDAQNWVEQVGGSLDDRSAEANPRRPRPTDVEVAAPPAKLSTVTVPPPPISRGAFDATASGPAVRVPSNGAEVRVSFSVGKARVNGRMPVLLSVDVSGTYMQRSRAKREELKVVAHGNTYANAQETFDGPQRLGNGANRFSFLLMPKTFVVPPTAVGKTILSIELPSSDGTVYKATVGAEVRNQGRTAEVSLATANPDGEVVWSAESLDLSAGRSLDASR